MIVNLVALRTEIDSLVVLEPEVQNLLRQNQGVKGAAPGSHRLYERVCSLPVGASGG